VTGLPIRHALLALAVVAIWGSNFVVIKLALATLPPFLFAALRFAFAFAPAALLVKRPAVAWRVLAAYGVLIGAGQFGLMFWALRADITPGLASLVIQTQVFFTIGLAMAWRGDRPRVAQFGALALAAAGLALIALNTNTSTTLLGLAVMMAAALCWAVANLIAQSAGRVDMLGFMVWSSLFAVPPLLVLSLVFDGAPAIAAGLQAATPAVWAAVLWQSLGNTLFGYGAWAWLLARHPASTIVPMALLVPVFGMSASAWWLSESLPAWKLGAAALVIAGLILNSVALRVLRP
jgi:O-acetylserine/cysteine efflux transporter